MEAPRKHVYHAHWAFPRAEVQEFVHAFRVKGVFALGDGCPQNVLIFVPAHAAATIAIFALAIPEPRKCSLGFGFCSPGFGAREAGSSD